MRYNCMLRVQMSCVSTAIVIFSVSVLLYTFLAFQIESKQRVRNFYFFCIFQDEILGSMRVQWIDIFIV